MPIQPLEIGAMFWAGRDPAETLSELTVRGFQCGQIGVAGDTSLNAAAWIQAADDAKFTIYTVIAAFEGEDYADIPTVERTVGFIPEATRAARERRMLELSDFAAAIGAPGIATHIGFVPHNSTDENYLAVREMVRRICDHAATQGQTFALETGQEPAEVLLSFLHDVNRPNLGINFDPANMILYGTGDPIEALALLGTHVLTVHAKDGDWPAKDRPDALGTEKALGQGSVGIANFIAQLKHVGYRGAIAIEREGRNPAQRLLDLQTGRALLLDILAG